MNRMVFPLLLIMVLFNCTSAKELINKDLNSANKKIETDVLVIGGGTGGTAAGIQSARSGAKSLIVEETSWLGGMISAAGVSATDGNHKLPSGIWNEFRNSIYKRYGGPEAVSTGWVSNTLFEPHVADSIFKAMAAGEKNLQVIYNYRFLNVLKNGKKVTGANFINNAGEKLEVLAKIIIDATELGDAFKDAGAGYDVGMEAKSYSKEDCAPDSAYEIIQDITYAVVLKDYGKDADKTIPIPENYDSTKYKGCCDSPGGHPDAESPCELMMSYGKLPNNKYMINWPAKGNDYYLNAIEMTYEERQREYQKAKNKALGYIYYLQTSLGYKNLGIADDEFPTTDKLPFIPYNREGRRVKGLVRFTVNDILHPFTQQDKLFKTSISVGDYPIDHHIEESFKIPPVEFPRIPSFGVPMGCLIPKDVDDMIVTEKGISVTNIVNGATRLQPCVLLTGQAAGILAAYCAANNSEPKNADIRKIQKELLDCNAYLMPYIDVTPDDPDFKAIQRVGATGIIQGYGVSYTWANQTWFYPERNISQYEIIRGLKTNYKVFEQYNEATGEDLNLAALVKYINMAGKKITPGTVKNDWSDLKINKEFSENIILNRRMAAVIIDYYLEPFEMEIDFHGNFSN
jgi:hypothetical protein